MRGKERVGRWRNGWSLVKCVMYCKLKSEKSQNKDVNSESQVAIKSVPKTQIWCRRSMAC